MSYKRISPIPVIEGGTQVKAWGTAYGLLCAGTTTINPVQTLPSLGAINTILTSGGPGSLPTWTTATYPATTTINQLLWSNAANNIVGLATVNSGVLITSAGGVPSIGTTLPSQVQGNITSVGALSSGSLTTGFSPIPLSIGGTNANLTANNGGIFYSTASAGAILAGTATANQVLLSGSNAAPIWSTAAYPASTTINQILYSSSNNVITGISSANNGILVTSSTGVPSISATFGQGLAVSGSQLIVGGANNIPFNAGKGIQDSNGNALLLFNQNASAVNCFVIINTPTGVSPILTAFGTDTNIASVIVGKGNAGCSIQGTTAGGNATAGFVGELISSVIANASAVAIVTNTPKDLTSISLTAGDWDVFGNINFQASGLFMYAANCWISLTSATIPDTSLYSGISTGGSVLASLISPCAPYVRVSISTTTTIYISGVILITAGTATMSGGIYARRVR